MDGYFVRPFGALVAFADVEEHGVAVVDDAFFKGLEEACVAYERGGAECDALLLLHHLGVCGQFGFGDAEECASAAAHEGRHEGVVAGVGRSEDADMGVDILLGLILLFPSVGEAFCCGMFPGCHHGVALVLLHEEHAGKLIVALRVHLVEVSDTFVKGQRACATSHSLHIDGGDES